MIAEQESLQRLLAEGSRGPLAQRSYGPDEAQVYQEWGPAQAATVVLVHGGYFRPGIDRTHARPMALALADQGWRVVLAEYRRVPGDPFVTVTDLTVLDRYLRGHGHQVAAWVGHSAGGSLVLWRALTLADQRGGQLPPVRVMALAPVADFDAAIDDGLGAGAVQDWIGAVSGARAHLDPKRLLAANPAAAERIQLVHGAQDLTVPPSQSQALAAWGVPLTVLGCAHHFDLIDPQSSAWPQVLALIDHS